MFKLKLNPNKEQKQLLRKFKGTERFLFNTTKTVIDETKIYDKRELRNCLATKEIGKSTKGKTPFLNPLFKKYPWLEETPKVIRQQAVFSCVSAYKSAISNLKSGNIKEFKINYKSKRKEKRWTLGIEKSFNFKNNILSILPTSLGKVRYYKRCLKKFDISLLFKDGKPRSDSYIHYNQKDYFLLIPYETKRKINNSKSSCSIDPGIRKFATIYSPEDQEAFFLGTDCTEKLTPLFFKLDNIQSLLSRRLTREKRRNYNRARRKIFNQIKNLKLELHHQISNFLTKKYSTIITPHFESKKLSQSEQLKSKVVRNMMTLAHCEFLAKLKYKCKERSVRLCIVPEEYTSKTCGRCGALNDIGSSEVYKCQHCNLEIDRDLNGARNEYLKSIHTIKIVS